MRKKAVEAPEMPPPTMQMSASADAWGRGSTGRSTKRERKRGSIESDSNPIRCRWRLQGMRVVGEDED